jgi:hypothetical protein
MNSPSFAFPVPDQFSRQLRVWMVAQRLVPIAGTRLEVAFGVFRAILYIMEPQHNTRQPRAAPVGRRTLTNPPEFSGSRNLMLQIRDKKLLLATI